MLPTVYNIMQILFIHNQHHLDEEQSSTVRTNVNFFSMKNNWLVT